MPKSIFPRCPNCSTPSFTNGWSEQRNGLSSDGIGVSRCWRLFSDSLLNIETARSALDLEHLTGAEVLAFLQHMEQERRASVKYAHCRLAALRSFFSFSRTRTARREAVREICECHSTDDTTGDSLPGFGGGFRPYCRSLTVAPSKAAGPRLMSLLYNTGARIQEALDLRPQDIHLKSPAHVRLMARAAKNASRRFGQRQPALITALMQATTTEPDERFSSIDTDCPHGFRIPLSPAPVCQGAVKAFPLLREARYAAPFQTFDRGPLSCCRRRCHCHSSWLGHAHLDTTNHYAQANLGNEADGPRTGRPKLRPAKPPRWKRDADLLAWLDSL